MQTLVTKHLAGLFNGISQQAPTLRLETQAENQLNGWSSLVYGLMTRPPTRFINKLSFAGDRTSLFHAIHRDSTEKYIVGIHKGGNIRVHDLNGISYPVVGLSDHVDYVNVSIPKNSLAVTTIADYTIIVNKTKRVETEMVYETFTASNPAQCKISGTAGTGTYSIKVDGSTVATVQGTHSIESGTGSTTQQKTLTQILEELRDIVNSHSGFSASYVTGETFTFRRTTGAPFNPTVEGALTLTYTPNSSVPLLYDTIAYIYVAKGVAEQNYSVYIDGSLVAQYVSGKTDNASSYKTDVIANNLYSGIVAKGYRCELSGSVMKVWKGDGSDFTFSTYDSWGDSALKGFKGRAQAFSDLPARCFDGAVLQIAGKTDSDEGSYWVKYETSYVRDGASVKTTGVWKEGREPNKEHKFNKNTMPIQLVRKQDIATYATASNPNGIYFSLEYCLWSERLVGDETSAPAPSFVGNAINDIFLFSNRLGVLSGQSICLTSSGDFFNFFPSTVTDALDAEPIDVDAPSLEVTELYHAIPSRDNLMLFSDNQQFILNSGSEPLTTKTVSVTSILQYPCDGRVAPVSIGQMAYYLSPRGKYISVREYFIQSDGVISDAPNITDHVPTYIKFTDLRPYFCGVANEDTLLIADGSTDVFVYKFNWVGDQKSQSSWSKWVFSRSVLTIHEFNNVLYVVFEDGSLEKIEMVKDNSLRFIDSMRKVTAGTLVGGSRGLHVYKMDNTLIETLESGTKTYSEDVYLGYPYEFVYEFSPMYLRMSDSGVGSVDGTTLLRRVNIFLEGNTAFDLTVRNIKSGKDRLTYNYVTPDGKPDRYSRSFLLRGESKDSTVLIKSTSDKPVILQSASFEILTSLISKPL